MSTDDLTTAFLATELHLWIGRRHVTLLPRPRGETVGELPTGVATVHVVTAWNPGGRRAAPDANAAADRRLREELAAAGWEAWDAEGWAPDDSWAEASVAVPDADEAAVLELARRFGQAAVYRWTAEERAVVWTDGRPDDVQGWELREVT